MFRALCAHHRGGQNCIIQDLVSSNSVGDHPVRTGQSPTGVAIPDAV